MAKQQCLIHAFGPKAGLLIAMDRLENDQTVEWWYLDDQGTGWICVRLEREGMVHALQQWCVRFRIEATMAFMQDLVPRVVQAKRFTSSLPPDDPFVCSRLIADKAAWTAECERGKELVRMRKRKVIAFSKSVVAIARAVCMDEASTFPLADYLVRSLMSRQLCGEDGWEQYCAFVRSLPGLERKPQVEPLLETSGELFRELGRVVGPVEMAYGITTLQHHHFTGT